MCPWTSACLQSKLAALIPHAWGPPTVEARGAFLQEEKQLLTVCPAVTVASLLRCFRGTPESSRCRRGGRRAVTGPSEGRVPSHRGGSSAPGNIPPLHRRSRSPEHNCSLGWMLPGTLPYTPEWTRRGCTVGRARTCPAVGGQPWGKGWEVKTRSQHLSLILVEHLASNLPVPAHSFQTENDSEHHLNALDFQFWENLNYVMPTPQTLLSVSGRITPAEQRAPACGIHCGLRHALPSRSTAHSGSPAGFTLDIKIQVCHFLLLRSDSEKTYRCLPLLLESFSTPWGNRVPLPVTVAHLVNVTRWPPGAPALWPAQPPGSQEKWSDSLSSRQSQSHPELVVGSLPRATE